MESIKKDLQYYKFCLYGFLKNQRFFDAFIILFFREMGFTFLEIGSLFAIREIATNIFEIPSGIVADAFGRRGSMILAYGSYIASFVVFYLLPSFGFYSLAMVCFALGEAFRSGTHKAMILEYLGMTGQAQLKVDYYGHTRSWSQRGSAISSLIAAGLVLYTGSYRVIFAASIVPYVLGLLLMTSYPKALDGAVRDDRKVSFLTDSWRQIVSTLGGFKDVFANREFLRATLNSSAFDAIFRTVKDYIQPILKSTALTLPMLVTLAADQRIAIVIGLVYFVLYMLTCLASASAGRVNRRLRSLPRAINLTLVLGAVVIVATGGFEAFHLPVTAIILFILLYMLQNLRRPLNVGYISELISNRIMASGLSVESQLKTLLVAVFAPVMGFLADRLGVGIALMAMGALLLIVSPVVFVARKASPPQD